MKKIAAHGKFNFLLSDGKLLIAYGHDRLHYQESADAGFPSVMIATTPVAPEVLAVMLPWLRGQFGNPSSAHPYGQRAAQAVATARHQVADLIGAKAQEIVFTGLRHGSQQSGSAGRGAYIWF